MLRGVSKSHETAVAWLFPWLNSLNSLEFLQPVSFTAGMCHTVWDVLTQGASPGAWAGGEGERKGSFVAMQVLFEGAWMSKNEDK